MTTTTSNTTSPTTRNTTSPIRRAVGLGASVCVLVTANAAFALPTTPTHRDLNSPLTLTSTHLTPTTTTTALTQGDLPTTTNPTTRTPAVRPARHASLD
ncbi:MAG: hypothetical protein ACI89L_001185 [Phycisphaerales bacterium]|jgi:hypothetical protein